MAVYTLAEIEATGRKAARGAGYPWGLAEEAGRGARWLAAWGEDGAAALEAHLQSLRGAPPDLSRATDADDADDAGAADDAGDGPSVRDPILAGALIADTATSGAGGPELGRVTVSPLLLGIVGVACEAAGLRLRFSWNGGTAVVGLGGVVRGGVVRMGAPTVASGLSIVPVREEPPPVVPRGRAAPVDPAVWAVLERFAHRTYVPESAASRALGAGSGLSDND